MVEFHHQTGLFSSQGPNFVGCDELDITFERDILPGLVEFAQDCISSSGTFWRLEALELIARGAIMMSCLKPS